MAKILLIHCRKGLFQITKCQSCGYVWECNNCTANLVTYRSRGSLLEMLCHQCQSWFKYPDSCPKCSQQQIFSIYGGIDELNEQLSLEYPETKITRLDVQKNYDKNLFEIEGIFLSTRIYDPQIQYNIFDKIIFIQADNLLASPDYLVQEEAVKNLSELFLSIQNNKSIEVIFDCKNNEADFFNELIKLNYQHSQNLYISDWYYSFLEKELKSRELFKFPPFINLLLLTTQEKTIAQSQTKINQVESYLKNLLKEYPELIINKPYPAKFLKRKGMFSHHILIRFPRNYDKFKTLRKEILALSNSQRIQIRLNPKHLF